MQDLAGQKLDKYRLIERLGRGSFGEVYKAQEEGQQKYWAIKIMYPDVHPLRDFIREISIIYRLIHPGIIQLRAFDVADVPSISKPLPFFVMDYYEHGTLGKRHALHPRPPLATIVDYIKQIAAPLQYVHDDHQLVHRDVKPANILIGERGELLLSDFGIATHSYTKAPNHQDPVGTLHYMAPEQFEGRAASASDQYALAVMTYEWLTGVPPFTGGTSMILKMHKEKAPPPLYTHGVSVPEGVEAVLMRALAKLPEQRFPRVLDFAEQFERALRPTLSAREQQTLTARPQLRTYSGHTEGVSALAWSPHDATIASVSGDAEVHVWNAATLQRSSSLPVQAGNVKSLAWSPDGHFLASAEEQGIVSIWQMGSAVPVKRLVHDERVLGLAWHPQQTRVAVACGDGVVRIWDWNAAKIVDAYNTRAQSVETVAWSPDGQYLACGCNDTTVRVIEADTHCYRSLYVQHTDGVASIAWLPLGNERRQYIASAGYDRSIHIWDIVTQEPFCIYTDHADAVVSLAWSPDGRYLASGSWDNSVRVWEATTRTCLHTYSEHTEGVSAVAWSPDGHSLASASWDSTVKIRTVST